MFLNTRLVALASVSLCIAGCAQYSKANKRPVGAVSVTAQQRALTKKLKPLANQPIVRIGLLLDSADEARERLAKSPRDTLARADYNFAVARVTEIIEEENLAPWDAPVVSQSATGASWSLTVPLPDPRPEYHPSNFEILPSDRYEFRGKLVGDRSVKEGLGAPVVVVGRDLDFTKYDEFAQGKQVFYGLTAVVQFNGRNCVMTFHDPLDQEAVSLDGNSFPLGADFQAPLALALADLSVEKFELQGFFSPTKAENHGRLARLQRYNPEKTPVLVIHGLGNSAATWVPTIDFLRSDPAIRENYQFWFFSYPSGLPYPIAAAALRERLDQIRVRYPNHKDMVVIGHSMGGMIARLLITDSSMKLWDMAFDQPPEEIPFHEGTRKLITNALIFDSEDHIDRVIFVSASHRGADMATSFAGKLGAKIIGNPVAEAEISDEALRYARRDNNAPARNRLPNSIDILDPESPFLKAVDTLPIRPDIPFHSLIGDRGKGGNLDRTKPVSSDGIVPYWSSHMEGAQSEVVIPSEHWSHLHPLGMAEIKRILIKHARSL